MPSAVDQFVSTYNVKLTSANTAMSKVDANVRNVADKEMATNLKPQDITRYAQQKQQLYEKNRKIQAEITNARNYKTQISNIKATITSLKKDVQRVEQQENAVNKPSEVTQYAKEKQRLYGEINAQNRQLDNISTSIGRMEYF